MRFQITTELSQIRSLINSLMKEILLLCSRFIRFFSNKKPYICKTFFDSLHIQGRSTGKTIGNSILLLLQRNGIDLCRCYAQAYDGAS